MEYERSLAPNQTGETASRSDKHFLSQMKRDLRISREIQGLLLPPATAMDPYEPAIFFQPILDIGGDLYNFFTVSSDIKGLMISDATGHGVSGALLASVIFGEVTAILARTLNPARVLNLLSQSLTKRLHGKFFATGTICLFDRRGYLYFANAGHNDGIYVRRRTGQVIRLEPTGAMLGLNSSYSLRRLQTESGDRVAFYTDGVVEALDLDGKCLGDQALIEILQNNVLGTSKEILERIQMLMKARAVTFQDDVTIIVLEIP